MNAAATTHWTDWNENATAEQKAVYRERYTKMSVDVEFRNTRMAEMTADWSESDADGDGKLNVEEFKVYITKAKARETTAGCYTRPDPGEARTTEMYNAANSIGEGEGIVMMDFFTVMGPWMTKYLEITAEVAPALLGRIKTYAAERYNEFAASATAEQQAAHWEF
jgi:hypothetical protein